MIRLQGMVATYSFQGGAAHHCAAYVEAGAVRCATTAQLKIQNAYRACNGLDTLSCACLRHTTRHVWFKHHALLHVGFGWRLYMQGTPCSEVCHRCQCSAGLYTALHRLARPAVASAAERLGPRARFRLRRTLDAWEYGSGADFRL